MEEEQEIEFYSHTALDGTITVYVIPDNGNTLVIPAGTPVEQRDAMLNAFRHNSRVRHQPPPFG